MCVHYQYLQPAFNYISVVYYCKTYTLIKASKFDANGGSQISIIFFKTVLYVGYSRFFLFHYTMKFREI